MLSLTNEAHQFSPIWNWKKKRHQITPKLLFKKDDRDGSSVSVKLNDLTPRFRCVPSNVPQNKFELSGQNFLLLVVHKGTDWDHRILFVLYYCSISDSKKTVRRLLTSVTPQWGTIDNFIYKEKEPSCPLCSVSIKIWSRDPCDWRILALASQMNLVSVSERFGEGWADGLVSKILVVQA